MNVKSKEQSSHVSAGLSLADVAHACAEAGIDILRIIPPPMAALRRTWSIVLRDRKDGASYAATGTTIEEAFRRALALWESVAKVGVEKRCC